MSEDIDHDMTAKQIAAKFNCSDRHILGLANAGRIPGLRIGTHWRFNLEEVKAAFRNIPAVSRKRAASVESDA